MIPDDDQPGDEPERIAASVAVSYDEPVYADIYLSVVASAPGFVVARLDGAPFACFDGEVRDACYTSALDFARSGLSEPWQATMIQAAVEGASAPGVVAIARGHWPPIMRNARYLPGGAFDVVEAWVAEPGSVSTGDFVAIRDNGIRCIVAPCPHLDETRLSDAATTAIDELDFTVAPFRAAQVDALVAATYTPIGILIAGDRYDVWGYGHAGRGRTVTAAYRRLPR